jgi:RNA polymerase sigma factor (sigma-70 family)
MGEGAIALRRAISQGGEEILPRAEELFSRLSGRIYNLACWHTRDPAAADDIVSIVFERVVKGLPGFDPTRASPDDWVFAIAINAVRDHFRSRKRSRTVSMEAIEELVDAGSTAEDTALERDRLSRLLAAMQRLRPREREILTLRLAGGLSNEAIGRLCRMRTGTVAVTVHRTVKALRAMLLEQEGHA